MNNIFNVSYIYIYIYIIVFPMFQCTLTCVFYVSVSRAIVYMYIHVYFLTVGD